MELAKQIHGRTVNRVNRDIIIASLTGVINPTDVDEIDQLKENIELPHKHKEGAKGKMYELCKEYPLASYGVLT